VAAIRAFVGIYTLLHALLPGVASAQEGFYSDKQIKLIVGFPPGGGMDTYARLLARHFGRHIQGQPTLIVQNMPGAASLVAVKYLNATAPKDGTAIVTFNAGLLLSSIVTPEKVDVKFGEFSWLGSIGDQSRVCYMWGATGVRTWDDVMKRDQVIMGDTGAGGGGASIAQRMVQQILGVKLKQVLGYPGGSDKRIAIERGELDGDCTAWSTIPSDWLRDRKINLVIRFQENDQQGIRLGLPYAGDLTKDADKKKLLDLFNVPTEIGQPYILSKEVPANRLEILRHAFDKTMSDPEFLADAQKVQVSISPVPGEKIDEQLKILDAIPASMIAAAKSIIGD
jgi:tripartite-type tricarboxylate transporter receptor subunit TctC